MSHQSSQARSLSWAHDAPRFRFHSRPPYGRHARAFGARLGARAPRAPRRSPPAPDRAQLPRSDVRACPLASRHSGCTTGAAAAAARSGALAPPRRRAGARAPPTRRRRVRLGGACGVVPPCLRSQFLLAARLCSAAVGAVVHTTPAASFPYLPQVRLRAPRSASFVGSVAMDVPTTRATRTEERGQIRAVA